MEYGDMDFGQASCALMSYDGIIMYPSERRDKALHLAIKACWTIPHLETALKKQIETEIKAGNKDVAEGIYIALKYLNKYTDMSIKNSVVAVESDQK